MPARKFQSVFVPIGQFLLGSTRLRTMGNNRRNGGQGSCLWPEAFGVRPDAVGHLAQICRPQGQWTGPPQRITPNNCVGSQFPHPTAWTHQLPRPIPNINNHTNHPDYFHGDGGNRERPTFGTDRLQIQETSARCVTYMTAHERGHCTIKPTFWLKEVFGRPPKMPAKALTRYHRL